MSALVDALSELTAAGGRLVGVVMDLLADRLELLGLEARELKIRLVQMVLLACFGAALLLLGLGLAFVAVLLVLPPPWRVLFAAGCGVVCLGAGGVALLVLRRRLARMPLPFSQTVAELKKDRECF